MQRVLVGLTVLVSSSVTAMAKAGPHVSSAALLPPVVFVLSFVCKVRSPVPASLVGHDLTYTHACKRNSSLSSLLAMAARHLTLLLSPPGPTCTQCEGCQRCS